MSETDINSESLENDIRLCDEVTEILRILTSAEKQGQSLYGPLKQISSMVNSLKNEYLIYLNQRLLKGFREGTTDEQIWTDCYFTLILELCDLLYDTKWKVDHANNDVTSTLLQA